MAQVIVHNALLHYATYPYTEGTVREINGKKYALNKTTGADYTGVFVEGYELDEWQEVGTTRPPLVTIFNVSGTYTPALGVKEVEVEMCGGGGGTNAIVGSNGYHRYIQSGGGSGAYAHFWLLSVPTSPVSIGSGTANLAGEQASFGSLSTCGGGSAGGTAMLSSASQSATINGGAGGTINVIPANVRMISYNVGSRGGAGYVLSANLITFYGGSGGSGGGTPIGSGGPSGSRYSNNSPGAAYPIAGSGRGSGAGGGSGAVSTLLSLTYGQPAVVIVKEYF